jgi:alkylation response protein AidB-like acyl-CoA dehydrogenase
MVAIEQKTDLIEIAKSFAPRIEAVREQSERERSMLPELARAMADAGLFRIWVPKALGGFEADIETNVRVVEEVAKADGAAGWNVMIAATGGMFAAYVAPEIGAEAYSDPMAITAGAINPKGHAVAVDGGFRLSGRWPLASGCPNATWIGGGGFVFDGDAPRTANGIPDLTLFLVPKDQATIIDTWYAVGLRGTGSHDFEVKDAFVPVGRTFSLLTGKPFYDGPLYRAAIISVFSPPVAAVALGIARAALDEFAALASGKMPMFTTTILRDKPTVQAQVGQAEALVRASRALLLEVIGSLWDTMCAGDPISDEQQVTTRTACAYAAKSCAEAVHMVYTMAGATSVYETSKLARCFRDAHVVTQHIAVQEQLFERTGRYFLGLGFQPFG